MVSALAIFCRAGCELHDIFHRRIYVAIKSPMAVCVKHLTIKFLSELSNNPFDRVLVGYFCLSSVALDVVLSHAGLELGV